MATNLATSHHTKGYHGGMVANKRTDNCIALPRGRTVVAVKGRKLVLYIVYIGRGGADKR